MKKLFVVLCAALALIITPALAKPAGSCKPKCKTHHMLKGHKVPESAKKKKK